MDGVEDLQYVLSCRWCCFCEGLRGDVGTDFAAACVQHVVPRAHALMECVHCCSAGSRRAVFTGSYATFYCCIDFPEGEKEDDN